MNVKNVGLEIMMGSLAAPQSDQEEDMLGTCAGSVSLFDLNLSATPAANHLSFGHHPFALSSHAMKAFLLALCVTLSAQTRPDASSQAVASQKAKLDSLWKKMTDRLESIDRSLAGVMGVAVLDLTDGREYHLRGDEIFPTASSIKIAILAELCRQGKLDDLYTLDAKDLVAESIVLEWLTPGVSRITNRDLATFMTTVSDNGATNVLIGRVGMDNVNTLMEKLGLAQTRLRRKMIDLPAARAGRENTSTPREMVRLLEALYRNRIEGSTEALRILKLPKADHFPKGLPKGITIANKPGSLEGVRTDSAIIYAPGRPVILSVMTAYLSDDEAGEVALAKSAAAVYDCFRIMGSASTYGRAIPQ